MELTKDFINNIISEIVDCDDITLNNIPDIDLYMDQVTTFIDNKLCKLKREDKDKLLTKTMINNYTKSKILPPSKNKRYNKHHVIILILIYYLKQTLSISDIQKLFNIVLPNSDNNRDSSLTLESIYSLFLDIKNSDLQKLSDEILSKTDYINSLSFDISNKDKDAYDILLLVLTLTAQAYTQKRLAEKIIDTYFSDLKNSGS